jgi:hypothetical protein
MPTQSPVRFPAVVQAEQIARVDAMVRLIEGGSRNQWIAEACWRRAYMLDVDQTNQDYNRTDGGDKPKRVPKEDGHEQIRLRFTLTLGQTIKRQARRMNETRSNYIAAAIELALRSATLEDIGLNRYKIEKLEAYHDLPPQ